MNHPTFASGVVKLETYDIQPQGMCLRHTTECQQPLNDMNYDIHSRFDHFDEYSTWVLWPMFSFQVYPGNVLNTYHWCTIDAQWSSFGAGGILLGASKTRRSANWRYKIGKRRWKKIFIGSTLSKEACGYRPSPLVVDPKGGVNSKHPVMHLQRWMREAIDRP